MKENSPKDTAKTLLKKGERMSKGVLECLPTGIVIAGFIGGISLIINGGAHIVSSGISAPEIARVSFGFAAGVIANDLKKIWKI